MNEWERKFERNWKPDEKWRTGILKFFHVHFGLKTNQNFLEAKRTLPKREMENGKSTKVLLLLTAKVSITMDAF